MDESELREACRRYMDGDITKEELAGVRDAAGTIRIDLHAACRAENAALRTRVIELDDWMAELTSHAVYERCTLEGQLAGMRCRFCQEESRRGEGFRHAATCLLLSAPVRDGLRAPAAGGGGAG